MRSLVSYDLVLSALIVCMPSHSEQQPLVVGAYHYPPFMNQSNTNGLYVQLAKAIETDSDVRFEWAFYPYARLDRYFDLSKIHIEIGSSPSWNQHKTTPGEYTQTFYQLEDVAVYRASDPKRAVSIIDIHGQDIGMVRGYSFPQFKQAFHAKLARRVEGANETQLLELLINERIDQAFMSKHVFLALQKTNPMYQELKIGDVVGHYDVSIRVHPDKAHVIDALNTRIDSLKRSGYIKRLFESQY